MPQLRTEQITKSYRGRQVLKSIDLEINDREIVGLLGPNGAGKTTTFYIVVGLTHPDSGRVFYNDEDILDMPMYLRAREGIGYLAQEASVFRKLTVAENIESVLETMDLTRSEIVERRDRLIDELHLNKVTNQNGYTLSGGERRRCEIARALATEPDFILLDEPFAGVDPISVIDIKKIIQHLKERGLGVLITDHNVRETLDVCEKAYIVSHGKMIAEGAPADILADEQVKRVYLGDQFSL